MQKDVTSKLWKLENNDDIQKAPFLEAKKANKILNTLHYVYCYNKDVKYVYSADTSNISQEKENMFFSVQSDVWHKNVTKYPP